MGTYYTCSTCRKTEKGFAPCDYAQKESERISAFRNRAKIMGSFTLSSIGMYEKVKKEEEIYFFVLNLVFDSPYLGCWTQITQDTYDEGNEENWVVEKCDKYDKCNASLRQGECGCAMCYLCDEGTRKECDYCYVLFCVDCQKNFRSIGLVGMDWCEKCPREW